jgi:hypothetical protein
MRRRRRRSDLGVPGRGSTTAASSARPAPAEQVLGAHPAADPRNIVRSTAEPVVRVQIQTDFYFDGGYSRRPDADTRTDRYRRYEVPGSAHT